MLKGAEQRRIPACNRTCGESYTYIPLHCELSVLLIAMFLAISKVLETAGPDVFQVNLGCHLSPFSPGIFACIFCQSDLNWMHGAKNR